ncbi:MAG: PspC domain-containing protein [Sporichthyaceae bacterium]
MTESTHTPAGLPDSSATGSQAPRFRRSSRDRMLAGVCGGIGEALGVDPVVIRVAVVVLTFFGGAGVVAYGACWLFFDEADEQPSPVQRALGRRTGGGGPGLAVVLLLSLAVLFTLHSVFLGWGPGHDRGPFPLLVLVALFAVGYALLKRRTAEAAAGPLPPAAGAPAQSAPVQSAPVQSAPVQGAALDLGKTTSSWTEDSPSWTAPPDFPPSDSPPPDSPAPPPMPASPPRPRSSLGRATFSMVLIALGVLAVAQALGLDVPPTAYPATVLAIVGAALVVSARYGRARGLIPLGVLALIALGPASLLDEFEGRWTADGRPLLSSAGTVEAEYRYRVGQVVLDLSGLDPTRTHTTLVRLGAGESRVLVPDTMDVVVDATLRAGELEVLGERSAGFDNHRTVRDEGADGPGGGTLNLTIDQGIGHVAVIRVPASTVPQSPEVPNATA